MTERAARRYIPGEIYRTAEYTEAELERGVPAFKALVAVGLAESGSAARRLIQQGGASVNGRKIKAFNELITLEDVKPCVGNTRDGIILCVGKWRRGKILIRESDKP